MEYTVGSPAASDTLITFLSTILLPPLCFLLLCGTGLALWRWRPRLGRNLTATSLALLWICSMPAFNIPFLERLGWPGPVKLEEAKGAQVIVVLAGGIERSAAEYGYNDTVNGRTLERVRYAAWLHRQTALPILASGGVRGPQDRPEAELMKSALEQEFSTPVKWVEGQSDNTLENARASAKILRDAGVGRIVLVTHSMHMRRAVQAFASTGIEVVAAPIAVYTREPYDLRDFLPSPVGVQASNAIAHELLGRLWYWIKTRFG